MSTTQTRLASTRTDGQRHPAYFVELYERARAEVFGLSFDDFGDVLENIRRGYLPSDATAAEIRELHRSLRVEELALARACALGNEAAWDEFLVRFRQKLYDAAAAIAREESIARELADSLYAELFGMRQTGDGQRISKLSSYTGRGSLEGWLRSVLAQNYVSQYRRQRKLVTFDEKTHSTRQSTSEPATGLSADSRLGQAVDAALLQLSAEDRLILASYYLDERTLAEIARMLRVHESTISRRLGKVTEKLRKRTVRELRRQGLSARAAAEAIGSGVRQLNPDLQARLVQNAEDPRKEKFTGTFNREADGR